MVDTNKETQKLVSDYERLLGDLKEVSGELLSRINDDDYDIEYEDFEDRGDNLIDIWEHL